MCPGVYGSQTRDASGKPLFLLWTPPRARYRIVRPLSPPSEDHPTGLTGHEPGTLRFDVYDVPGEPDAVYLYEAYANDEAYSTHCEGAPVKKLMDHIVPNVIANMDVLLQGVPSIAANIPH